MLEKQNPENKCKFLRTEFAPEYSQNPSIQKVRMKIWVLPVPGKYTQTWVISYNKFLLWRLFFNAIFSRTRVGFFILGGQWSSKNSQLDGASSDN
jgi:hypothetical protein